jgi:hypothetical protein
VLPDSHAATITCSLVRKHLATNGPLWKYHTSCWTSCYGPPSIPFPCQKPPFRNRTKEAVLRFICQQYVFFLSFFFLLFLQVNCSFVTDALQSFVSRRCPPLRKAATLQWVAFLILALSTSALALFSLFLHKVMSQRRRQRARRAELEKAWAAQPPVPAYPGPPRGSQVGAWAAPRAQKWSAVCSANLFAGKALFLHRRAHKVLSQSVSGSSIRF